MPICIGMTQVCVGKINISERNICQPSTDGHAEFISAYHGIAQVFYPNAFAPICTSGHLHTRTFAHSPKRICSHWYMGILVHSHINWQIGTSINRHILPHSCSTSPILISAFFEALCSADFFLLPCPSPITSSPIFTWMVKCLFFPSPFSPTTSYTREGSFSF